MAMAVRRAALGSVLTRRWLLLPAASEELGLGIRSFSTSQVQEDTDLEHGKMVNEGGGSDTSFEEAKAEQENKSTLKNVVEKVKHQAEVEKNTVKDMFKDAPEKSKETTEELKETAAVAGQAVKRDVEKLAEKVGIRDSKPGGLKNE